eukprot:2418384-Amphidinium_carterae.2
MLQSHRHRHQFCCCIELSTWPSLSPVSSCEKNRTPPKVQVCENKHEATCVSRRSQVSTSHSSCRWPKRQALSDFFQAFISEEEKTRLKECAAC